MGKPQHRKQRVLRPHAPKGSASYKASPEEHPDDAVNIAPPKYVSGHNTEKEKSGQ